LDYQMNGWLKDLVHKPLKALAQALPVAAAFIPGVGAALAATLGAGAAAAITQIGTSLAVNEAMRKIGPSSVQPLVAATLVANGTDPTAANVAAATAALQAQTGITGVPIAGMTVDDFVKKYWMYAAGGLLFAILLLKR
jgi:hypothetical protein